MFTLKTTTTTTTLSALISAVVCRVRRGRCAVIWRKEVEFDDCIDDFKDQTRRCRHDLTVDNLDKLLAALYWPEWRYSAASLDKIANTFIPSRHRPLHVYRSLACSRLVRGILHCFKFNCLRYDWLWSWILVSGDPVSIGYVTVLRIQHAETDDLETCKLHARSIVVAVVERVQKCCDKFPCGWCIVLPADAKDTFQAMHIKWVYDPYMAMVRSPRFTAV